MTEEEFFKEYADEFAKENPSFSEQIKKLPSIKDILKMLWYIRMITIPLFLSMLVLGVVFFYGTGNSIFESFSLSEILNHIRQFIILAAVMTALYFVARKNRTYKISNDSMSQWRNLQHFICMYMILGKIQITGIIAL